MEEGEGKESNKEKGRREANRKAGKRQSQMKSISFVHSSDLNDIKQPCEGIFCWRGLLRVGPG